MYGDFCKSDGRFEREIAARHPEAFSKRLLYYCKSRRWMEHVFGLSWQTGFKLQRLIPSDQNIFIISEHPDPTEKVYAGGKQQFHFSFCAASPVLQRLISFRLWPEQVSRARDLVVGLRRTIGERRIPLVRITGSVGLSWPHSSLLLQRGMAVIRDEQTPDIAMARVTLMPGLHSDARLTWWRGLADYSTQYIASDSEKRFMAGGICVAKLDQKLSDHCQMRVLDDKGWWSEQLFRFKFAGYRCREPLKGGGLICSVLYLREFDEKTGQDHFWLQDVIAATPLDLLLHMLMRKFHGVYLKTGRLRLMTFRQLEELGGTYLSLAGKILRERKRQTGLDFPASYVVQILLSGYYRQIDGALYFVPPGMQSEPDETLKTLDEGLGSLKGKQNEGRNFYRSILDDNEDLKTAFLTWLMERINGGLRPWISDEVGMSLEELGG